MIEEKSKKRRTILKIVFAAIAGVSILLPILGTFSFSIPEWSAVLPLIPLLILSALLPKKLAVGRAQKKVAVALPIVAVMVSLISLFAVYCNPYFGSVTFRRGNTTEYTKTVPASEAAQDFKAVWRHLNKCHPMFYGGAPKELKEAYNATLTDIEAGGDLTVNELRRVISGFLSSLSDAHTNIRDSYSDDRILSAIPRWKAEGLTVRSTNGLGRAELVERAKAYSSYEVEEWISVDVGRLSSLDYHGIPLPVTYELETSDGEIITETYDADAFVTFEEYEEIYAQYFPAAEDNAKEQSFVRYEIDRENSLALLTLDSCQYNKVYNNTLSNMFEEVKTLGIKYVAVDLRSNGGGNSLVADEFIKYLPADSYKVSTYKWRLGPLMLDFDKGVFTNDKYEDLTFYGDVFILTSNNTFSSAMLFTEYISDNGLGTVIGEPPANAANSYGDITIFELPNSGLRMSCSTKIFRRASGSDELLIMPDVPCDSEEVMSQLFEIVG